MTDENLNPEGDEVRSRPWHESAEILISNNFWRFAFAGATAFVAYLYFDPETPAIPRYAEVIFWTAVLGSPAAYILAARAVDMLHDPYGILFVDLDARETGIGIWNIPKKRWEEIEVVDGDLYRLDASRTVYSGKNFDPENLTVEGTWRGSMSDVEMLRTQEKIAECRGQLEDMAKEGFTVEVQKSSIVRGAVRDISRSVIGSLEEGTVYNGEKIAEAVDRATARYDFDRETEDTQSGDETETPDPDHQEKQNGEETADLDEVSDAVR